MHKKHYLQLIKYDLVIIQVPIYFISASNMEIMTVKDVILVSIRAKAKGKKQEL